MKKSLLTVLSLIAVMHVAAGQQWTMAEDNDYLKFNWYRLGPQEVEGNEIFSTTGDHVIYSDNFGANWIPLRYISNTYSGNPDLVMKNSHRLIALGYATVIGGNSSLWAEYRTGSLTDSLQFGGWNNLGIVSNYSSGRYRAGEFLDDSIGFIFGQYIGPNGNVNILSKTEDGGATWDSVGSPPAETPFHIVDNDTFYYQKTNTRALYLWDGTNETELVPAAGTSGLNVFPFDAQNVVIYRKHFSGKDSLWITDNAGITYQKKEMDMIPDGYWARSVYFASKRIGAVVVDSSYQNPVTNNTNFKQLIFTTADGGDTWSAKEFDGYEDQIALGVYLQDTNSLMIMENNGSRSDIFHYGCHIPRRSVKVGLNAPLTYDFGGAPIGTSGFYTDTLISYAGCDSIVNLDFTSFVGAYYKFNDNGTDERSRTLNMNVQYGYGDDRFGNADAAATFYGDPMMPDPSNDIGIIEDAVVNVKNNFSISAHINVDFDASQFNQVICRTNAGMNLVLDDSTLQFNFVGKTLSSSQTLSDETWHHVVLQKEDTTFIMYLDQQEVGRKEFTRAEIDQFPEDYRWFVGANRGFDPGSGQSYNIENLQGAIDDLMFVSRALSASERASLFAGQDIFTSISSSIEGENITVFPNPSNGICMLKFTEGANRTIRVKDIQGSLVKEFRNSEKLVTLDLTDIRKGFYLVEVINRKQHSIQRILIK